MAITLTLLGCALNALGGVVALLLRHPGRHVSAVLGALGCTSIVAAGTLGLSEPRATVVTLAWPAAHAAMAQGVDALSAAFLLPIGVLGTAASIFSLGYWDAHPSGPRTRFATSMLLVGMTLVVTARHGLGFLLAWELMALSAWLAMEADHCSREVRDAGWVYLVFTHAGTACLTAMVLALGLRIGSFDWIPQAGAAHPLDGLIVGLALVGFGAKAGLVPLHAWLPGAHASAPSHVSALLSGVMLKTGIYGVLRITGLLPGLPAMWGAVLLGVGAATALYGIASALSQRDFKRILACSSIENLGIIALAVGLALWAAASSRSEIAVLAGSAAVLHVWHHATFKGLLFFGAGAVLHATGTRAVDRLGGLATRMPLSSALLLFGSATASGLPGFAGFASEWVLYCAGFAELRTGGRLVGAAVILTLALAGGIAVAAYSGMTGALLLGTPRSPDASHAHDPGPSMTGPLLALAGLCFLLPLVLPWTLAATAPAVGVWLQRPAEPVPLPSAPWLAGSTGALVALGLAAFWLVARSLNARPSGRTGTWDCGYAAPTSRMQYTLSSFTAVMSRESAPWLVRAPATLERPAGRFPDSGHFETHPGDGILDRWFRPAVHAFASAGQTLRLLQQGHIHAYLIYILLVLLALLVAALTL